MAKVAREMVERAGVDVDQLLELLVKNAAAELTTYYYYTILRVNLIGLEGEGIKEIAETARIEELGLRITRIVEKRTRHRGMMRVTVNLSLAGKKQTVNIESDNEGVVWEGYRVVHKSGWRSNATLEVTKAGE